MSLTKVTYSMIEGATVNIFDYIPQSEHAAIEAGTSTYDCTTAIALAIADASAAQGDPYGYEKVIIFPEGWYNVQYIDLTARRNVWMWAQGYVVIKGIDSAAKNFIYGSTNYDPITPSNSTQTDNAFLGGPGQWEFFAAPGTSYAYGMRLEHFTSSHFENVSAGSGYVTSGGNITAAYLQYTYSNLFVNCGFSCPAAPPPGGKSIGLAMGNNNVNSNTFIRCNWQGAGATAAPYTDTIGVFLAGNNNVFDNCDLSALDTAFSGVGKGIQIRNVYSEYVTTFLKGGPGATLQGCVVQGGLIEIVNNGSAFDATDIENLTIIGGYYKGAFAGTRNFIEGTSGSLYGINVIGPRLETGAFANTYNGTYQNPDFLAEASILQAKWLTFPQNVQLCSDPNTLDDYEEGTFDAAITFGGASTGITYTQKQCSYTKIGNRVTVSGSILLSSKGSATGIARIADLPFAITNAFNSSAPPSLWLSKVTFADVPSGYGNINATTIDLTEVTNGGVVSFLTDADFANDSQIIFQMTYRTSA